MMFDRRSFVRILDKVDVASSAGDREGLAAAVAEAFGFGGYVTADALGGDAAVHLGSPDTTTMRALRAHVDCMLIDAQAAGRRWSEVRPTRNRVCELYRALSAGFSFEFDGCRWSMPDEPNPGIDASGERLVEVEDGASFPMCAYVLSLETQTVEIFDVLSFTALAGRLTGRVMNEARSFLDALRESGQ